MADAAFHGFVETTFDALLIFEGCRQGLLPMITRRLQEYEKRALVGSGAVFVFDEETGIKRWTDGLAWSPSRTLGNFLVYRELDRRGPNQASSTDYSASAAGEQPDTFVDDYSTHSAPSIASGSGSRRGSSGDTGDVEPPLDPVLERALVGSLTNRYQFQHDGLVKKTISLGRQHMISYYKIDDVTSGRLRAPSSQPELALLHISADFLSPSLFRNPPLVGFDPKGHPYYISEAQTPQSPLATPLISPQSSHGLNTPTRGSVGPSPFVPKNTSMLTTLLPILSHRVDPERDRTPLPRL